MDVVFMGTAPFGFPVMRSLAERDDVTVKGVFTQPDRRRGRGQEQQSPPVAEYAEELDLPLLQPESINDDGIGMLKELGDIDLAFLIAYGQFLDPEVFQYPAHGTYNFHASLLPRWRGAAPIRHTLLAGDDETGVTIFQLREGMDTGPICEQVRTAVEEDDTYGELYERLSELNVGALKLFLEELKADRLECRPQEGEPTYAPMIDSDDARVDWASTAVEIERQIRAYCPDPGAFSHIADQRIKLYRAHPVEPSQAVQDQPGRIHRLTKEEFHVETGEGVLAIDELQPAGSQRMDVADYLAGNPPIAEGDRFEHPAEKH